jgi:hypothetical protein
MLSGRLKVSTVGFCEGHLEQHIVPALGSRLVSPSRESVVSRRESRVLRPGSPSLETAILDWLITK